MIKRRLSFINPLLSIIMIILLLIQVCPVSLADSGLELHSARSSSSSYDRADFGEMDRIIIPSRSKLMSILIKTRICHSLLLLSEVEISPIDTDGNNAFIPCMRQRIQRLMPYKINGTNIKKTDPSF